MAEDISKVDQIIDTYGLEQKGLIPVLLDIQTEYHYLPPEAIQRVSERMNIPMIQVYQVASFYKVFSLEPRGKHIITVCMGTACHVRGSTMLVDQISRVLHVEPGETTKDMQFTLEEVNCLGACALGPVMVIDGKYYGKMTVNKIEKTLSKYMETEVVANE
ncbi:NAD(P)H-dependent oxidoreductase subunit E [bacterium]|nr:NAD(P)H-dependent oxidoreductase subunit E [bacterium]